MSDYWRESREITERIVVEGDLVLLTPASLGNGDADGLTDMSLLLDEFEGKALLTGTSIAGALRNYLRECSLNYGISEESKYKDEKRESVNVPLPIITQIFGSLEDDGAQSLLIVDDAIGGVPRTELRDGVKIDGKMRTAEDGKKFDLELLEAGTSFPLRFELLICEQKGKDAEERKRKTEEFKTDLLKAFAAALQGFETGEIHLGARKRRGYGECEIKKWRVKTFKLCGDQDGLIDWLKNGAKPLSGSGIAEQTSIAAALKVSPIADRREYFEMNACFALEGSMLIRSGSKLSGISEKGQPDTVHLRSKHKNKGNVPIVSGTSLAGVLRHRAVKICRTISPNGSGGQFVENIFGVDMNNRENKTNKQPFASRLEVKETCIENTADLVQTRVKIDRFTGGAFEGALFDAAPVFAESDGQALAVSLKLRNAKNSEIGLLLLLLKDLWTSDLAIGGESSIGRGRLKGISARLHKRTNENDFWKVNIAETDTLDVRLVAGKLSGDETEMEFLNNFVGNLKSELEKDNAKN